MRRNKIKLLVLFFLFTFTCTSSAGNNDYVKKVYSCGDDVAIEMQNAGWVFAKQSQIGEKRVDRILSIALSLLTTGKPTGYFDEGTPESFCGITNIKPITVLAITSGN